MLFLRVLKKIANISLINSLREKNNQKNYSVEM